MASRHFSTKEVHDLPSPSRDLPIDATSTGGFSEQFGGVFAVPGIAEKGYMDVSIEVHTAGGHSSIPPKHTVSIILFITL
jgi:acetylornithine deacetylase/succinyl-diaminopimelate desuccinylase-like protein